MLRAALPLLLLVVPLLAPTGIAPPTHDREGTILVGTGLVKAYSGHDHYAIFSPYDAVGFSLYGDVEYEYLRVFDSGGSYYRVSIVAPAGALSVPWALDWARSTRDPSPQVPFVGVYASTCTNMLCHDLP